MQEPNLSEQDIENIFAGKKLVVKQPFYLLFAFILFILFVLTYFFINFSSFGKVVTYWYHNYFNTTQDKSTTDLIAANVSTSTKTSNPTFPAITDNHILIPKIDVNAPIIWQVNNTPGDTATGLESGVIQILGTALPGQTGNVFITGHSSNYIWAKGNYKSIFALLPQLAVGDTVLVKYQNINYLYKINNIKTVKPTDLSVIAPTKTPILTLMTCVPVGTSINRLIVTADQIYPDPKLTTGTQKNAPSGNLPAIH